MRILIRLVYVFSLSIGLIHGAVDVKNLWHSKSTKSKKKSYRQLWTKKVKPTRNKSKKNVNTVERIENSKSILEQTSSMQKQMNQQLGAIAKTIRRATLENIAINKVLARLKSELNKNESKYTQAQSSISKYGSKIKKLGKTITSRHQAYIKLLSDQFALALAMKTQGGSSIDTILRHETYEVIKEKNTKELMKLKGEIDGSNKQKMKLINKQHEIKQSISSLRAKWELYDRKKEEKKALLAKLSKKEDEYRKKLKEIMQSQQLLRQTLAKLNILRKKEIAEAKRAEEARREELNRRIAKRQEDRDSRLSAQSDSVSVPVPASSAAAGSVKQYGSSYQDNNIQAYRGAHTISPLYHAKVVKKFGSYIDPIYKIKIFNDNIVLKSTAPGAKVRNVLNGKVVYVGENSMLGKVIIIEHSNRLHTIYASLDRISPLLHVGSRVKKGVIIGRIKRKLIFQATQNSKYINPLRLIRL
jgi:murein DD-endopeptidase MepM/ murein hydrolase activator NlpD